ncbi:MAG: dihydropteroate synthase [Bacteroidales bacterium]|nr:dihydropteroate synthase [Bacteroidales bacterium]
MSNRDIKVMGIINVNDDSYFEQSRARQIDAFASRAERLIQEGADVIDIGACSTRPGAEMVDSECEWGRLNAVLELWNRKSFSSSVQLSIDTFRSEIVSRAFDVAGHLTVNDISAGSEDDSMLKVVSSLHLPYIAMHRRGTCATMHEQYRYENILSEVLDYFRKFEQKAVLVGLEDYIIDPGFGFSKSIEENYVLLNNLSALRQLHHPVLVGLSRKRMIYETLGITPQDSLPATCAIHLHALLAGADILRVHDVKEAVECVKLYHTIEQFR